MNLWRPTFTPPPKPAPGRCDDCDRVCRALGAVPNESGCLHFRDREFVGIPYGEAE